MDVPEAATSGDSILTVPISRAAQDALDAWLQGHQQEINTALASHDLRVGQITAVRYRRVVTPAEIAAADGHIEDIR